MDPTPDTRHLTPRSGITLVELLVTIVIISILAGLVLGVAAVAAETAREAHTRHVVERLHTLLMAHYDTYKSRRVRLRPEVERAIDNSSLSQANKGRAKAIARLNALREMMLMEIPDRWSDVLLDEVRDGNLSGMTPRYPRYLDVSNSSDGRTALGSVYLRRLKQAALNGVDGEALKDNQGAECLYMVITVACGDGEARAHFGESSIGDTDGDGLPEFLDGWGNPISFLRWAPGFDSLIQLDANELGDPVPGNTQWISDTSVDHDPFDVFRMDQFAYRLVPLIFSPGRDETYGIMVITGATTWRGDPNRNTNFTLANPPALEPNPYVKRYDDDTKADWYLGTDIGTRTSTDNIHNHLLGQR